MLKNINYDNDNDKLQCFTKTFHSQKYKKCFPGKYALLLYVAVSICWIVIRFDFCQVGALKYKYTPFFLVFRKMKKKG